MKKIVLYGAGGMGRECAARIEQTNRIYPDTYRLLGFLVDEAFYHEGQAAGGYPILGTEKWILEHKDVYCTCTIAENSARERIQRGLMKQGVQFESLVSPDVAVPSSARLGCGCIIASGVALSADTRLGDGVFINDHVTIGHDSCIGAFSTVLTGTGISGNCQIGERVKIGGHAYILPKKKVGDDAVVAAGSVVFRNVKAGTTVLGNPAKRVSFLEG